MPSHQELKPGLQMHFVEKDAEFTIPSSVSSSDFGPTLIRWLPKHSLWRRMPRGDHLIRDLRSGQNLVFERDNWQVTERVPSPATLVERSFATITLILPASDEKSLNGLSEQLVDLSLSLKPFGLVFILEEKGNNQEENWRKQLLEKAGLVKKAILAKPKDYLLWRARLPKEYRLKTAANLLEKRLRRNWLRGMCREVIKNYRHLGFRIISWQEIVDRLKASTFPIRDIVSLKLGYGVKLEANCGCRWQVDERGSWTRHQDCGDPDCDGVPKEPVWPDMEQFKRFVK